MMFELGGELVKVEVVHNLMRLIAVGSGDDDEQDMELHRDAVDTYLELMEKPVLPDILVCAMAWVLGEYGYLSEAMHVDEIAECLCELIDRPFENEDVTCSYIHVATKCRRERILGLGAWNLKFVVQGLAQHHYCIKRSIVVHLTQKVDPSPAVVANAPGLVPLVPCRDLWLMRFKGDPSSSRARPLPLTLQGNDRKHFDNARSIVQWLIECGLIASEQALSAMATSELMKVFVKALAQCLDVDDAEIEAGGRTVAHPSFRGMTLNQVASLNYVAIATSLGSRQSRPLPPDALEARPLDKRPRTDTAKQGPSIQTTANHSRGLLNQPKLPASTPNESSEFTYPITTC
ncbi:Aste57867_14434 [Aphanomyces stellatus]|uniref:Aste57867_14434 protein n=1 Tax=Aphanomyces stellatus TaxID=120398 RepID=A0A485L0Z7_9STRA|nr:hypothetical protein As57867_014380 [Aphanomyces stellatus]VFT91256.1 Aste57867_14434 [Aphanomyces stellatus]